MLILAGKMVCNIQISCIGIFISMSVCPVLYCIQKYWLNGRLLSCLSKDTNIKEFEDRYLPFFSMQLQLYKGTKKKSLFNQQTTPNVWLQQPIKYGIQNSILYRKWLDVSCKIIIVDLISTPVWITISDW